MTVWYDARHGLYYVRHRGDQHIFKNYIDAKAYIDGAQTRDIPRAPMLALRLQSIKFQLEEHRQASEEMEEFMRREIK